MTKGLGLFNPKLIHKLRTVFTYVGEKKHREGSYLDPKIYVTFKPCLILQ